MQPAQMCPIERPLRRVSSVRSSIDAQANNSNNNSEGFSAMLERLDSKFEKSTSTSPCMPQSGRAAEMGTISELDFSCDAVGGGRRSFTMDQSSRKGRAIVSYCLGGILSLFFLVQIITGGLGLLSNPVTLSGVKHTETAFLSEKHDSSMLERRFGQWKPLTLPLKQIATIEPWRLLSNKMPEEDSSVKTMNTMETRSIRKTAFLDTETAVRSPDTQQKSQQFVSNLQTYDQVRAQQLKSGKKEGILQQHVTDRSSNPEASHQVVRSQDRSNQWFKQPVFNFHQCVEQPLDYQLPLTTNGYLLIFANGGLNQMRTAICDMVAVARIMNATFVIPELDKTSYWADPSDFGDVFDLEHFINTLKEDVHIIRELPLQAQNYSVFEMAPKSWSETIYYEEEVTPLLKEHNVVRFVLTDSRLANNRIPAEIQRLRCKANYHALRFHPDIENLSSKIVDRLRAKGPYIALHLRFEKDMLAFSGCTYGLSEEEAEELKQIRYNVTRWKEKEIDPVLRRALGGCPLTPHEIGLMLRAMGYPKSTMIYIAAGQIYGGQERMKTFTSLFPNIVTKDTIASAEELEPFSQYQNRLAAIDYTVAVESDVFVPTYDGNMARAVQGHRRFQGHRSTIIPDRIGLVKLLDAYHSHEMDWSTLRRLVVSSQRGRQGSPHYRKPLSPSRAKLEENFYANPLPGCICESNPDLPSPKQR